VANENNCKEGPQPVYRQNPKNVSERSEERHENCGSGYPIVRPTFQKSKFPNTRNSATNLAVKFNGCTDYRLFSAIRISLRVSSTQFGSFIRLLYVLLNVL
jgi:hypothetical protein